MLGTLDLAPMSCAWPAGVKSSALPQLAVKLSTSDGLLVAAQFEHPHIKTAQTNKVTDEITPHTCWAHRCQVAPALQPR